MMRNDKGDGDDEHDEDGYDGHDETHEILLTSVIFEKFSRLVFWFF